MGSIKRLFQSSDNGAAGRAGVLQIPVTESQKEILSPAIADIAEATANTKTNVMLRFLHDGAIGASDYEGACIEEVYRDAPRLCSEVEYPIKAGVLKGILTYVEGALTYANAKGMPSEKEADNLLRPMLQFFAKCAGDRQLKLHAPVLDWDPRFNLEKHYAKVIFDAIEREGGFVQPEAKKAAAREGTPPVKPLIDVVLDNWASCRGLGDYIFKYAFYLADATDNWDDTLTERLVFAEVCRTAYQWRTGHEREARQLEGSQESLSSLIRHNIKDGYVIAPARYQPLNPEEAATCSFAGVIEVANNPTSGTPSFIFFSRKPVSSLTTEEEENLLLKTGEKWINGSLSEIRKAEIALKADEDGKPVNLEQYLAQPRVVVSPIEEADFFKPTDCPPSGIVIRQTM